MEMKLNSMEDLKRRAEKDRRNEKITNYVLSLIAAGAVTGFGWLAVDTYKESKTKEKAQEELTAKLAAFKQKVLGFTALEENELILGYRDSVVLPTYETSALAPIARESYDQSSFENDRYQIGQLKVTAQKRELNLNTTGLTEKEIASRYKRIETRLEEIGEAREKLKDLHFYAVNDPRIRAIQKEVLDVVSLDTEERKKCEEESLRVDVAEVDIDAVAGQEGFSGDKELIVASDRLAQALNPEDPKHLVGLNTVAHELCHKIRNHQYGGINNYDSIYDNAARKHRFPEGYVTDQLLPDQLKEFNDLWIRSFYTHNTNPSVKNTSGTELLEREAFTVGAMVSLHEFENGGVIPINPQNKDLLEMYHLPVPSTPVPKVFKKSTSPLRSPAETKHSKPKRRF